MKIENRFFAIISTSKNKRSVGKRATRGHAQKKKFVLECEHCNDRKGRKSLGTANIRFMSSNVS